MITSEDNKSKTQLTLYISPLTLLILGLRVIGSEIHWKILEAIRKWEIRQLQKRLNQEYEILGQLEVKEAEAELNKEQEAEKELCLKQVHFLQEEIQFLQQALDNMRREYIKERLSAWKLET